MLSPGLSAKVLNGLEQDERERVISAGGKLEGSSERVSLSVVNTFFKSTDPDGSPSKDLNEVCRFLNLKYADASKSLVVQYRKAYF